MTLRSVAHDGAPVTGAPSSFPGPARAGNDVPPRPAAVLGRRAPALIAYVPAGDPAMGDPLAVLDAYADAGVAILEVGIPDADPVLDGPEVRESMARALAAGTDAWSVAAMLAAWRARRGPGGPALLWFAYPRIPLAALGRGAALGAIDAALILDAAAHAAGERLPGFLAAAGIARSVFLPWDPTPADRAAAAAATGYVMLQARPGVTGVAAPPVLDPARIAAAREQLPGRPIVAGFGVADARSARAIIEAGADGVVVGSACIRALREGGPSGLRAFLAPLVRAVAA